MRLGLTPLVGRAVINNNKGDTMNTKMRIQQISHVLVRISRIRFGAALILSGMLAAGGVHAAPATQSTNQTNHNSMVAVFRLSGQLNEAPEREELALFGTPGISLKELVERLQRAARDPDVKAVVIVPETAAPGPAQVEELRSAMAVVRAQGKEVYVRADSLMMGEYILACGASRISVVPTGMLLINGINGSSLHVRGLLDKIGVKPDFITEGAYKSASELFMREQPSPEADEMMNWIVDSYYSSFIDQIAAGRKVDAAKVRGWVDNALFTAEQAKAAGLIDAIEQPAEFEAMLKDRYGKDIVFEKRYGRKDQPELDLSSPFAFLKVWTELFGSTQKKPAAKPAIGIVYVDGPIMLGRSSGSPFGGTVGAFSSDLREGLEKAATDDSIRAVVLRVDSPGGSASASEIILDATRRVKARKPLVVSMGNVAGSGGYYVACASDTIFADATTLTASIGVVAGKVSTTEMWKKVGVTFKEYKRGQNAGILTSDDVFSESERARLRSVMDETYAIFKGHVTDIRGNRLKKPIDAIAGGRVFTGKQALELGLVDRLGTMSDAIEFAANEAKIKDYDVRVVPEQKSFIEQLLQQREGDDGSQHIRVAQANDMLLKLAAPYLANLDPQRTAAVFSALRRLEILRQEGVVLSMPGILLSE